LFPESADYVDVYDRAGGLGERTVLAHAVHLSDRELVRLVESGSRVAHCPISNLFLASGVMPLGRYLDAGLTLGLGSDVAGGPDLSIFSVMRVGFYAQNARRVAGIGEGPVLGPLDWLRLGSLGGAMSLGLGDRIGSLEAGKEADLIAVDPGYVAPIPGVVDEEAMDLASRLIFRAHPDMVRAAWVRGRRLEGPGSRD
jgi:guanine deaminase